MSLVIIDYGIGNLRSVQKAFEKVGCAAVITGDPEEVAQAERVVLPGVGAFADCMSKFSEARLREPVMEHLEKGTPLLGICVGMQMLFTTGHENGKHAGLGAIEGEVVRFPTVAGYKIPHMGWNQARVVGDDPFWQPLTHPAWYYFVHSYYCVPKERSVVALETEYMQPFCAAIQRERLLATQFHPEKSQQAGLALLKRFVEL